MACTALLTMWLCLRWSSYAASFLICSSTSWSWMVSMGIVSEKGPGNDWMNSQLWHNSVWFSSPYCSLGLQRACREQWLSSVLWFSVYSEVNLQIKQTLCWSCLDILNPFLVSTMDIHGSFSNAAKKSAVVLSRPVRRLFSRASQNRSTFHSALSDRCW